MCPVEHFLLRPWCKGKIISFLQGISPGLTDVLSEMLMSHCIC